MPATDRALALLLAGLTLLSRVPLRARLLPTWDAVQFALALAEYDIVKHQPHPPGYILYVGLGRLLATVVGDPAAALTWLAVVSSGVTVFLVYRLAWIFYGRAAAVIAGLGLATSPLFWFYGLVALPYTTEAALATAVASLVWPMRCGRARFALGSALALGLAGGVRQSLLFLLLPLWLGMAWAGLRRWRPVLAGLAVLGVTTLAWLLPMLELTGGSGPYLRASAELYESTVRATTVFGDPGGWLANVRGLAEAALMGLGLWLPVAAGGLLHALRHPAPGGPWRWFFAAWLAPPLLVYTLVHFGQYGYLLTVLPALYVILAGAVRAGLAALVPARRRPGLGAALLAAIALAHASYFVGARPADVPSIAGTAGTADRWVAWARAVYRFRFWALTAGGLREQEGVIGAYVDAVRAFGPADTVLVTELGNPRSYPWFRHATYYLSEFPVVHLRLGGFSPGYLTGPRVRTMAAVARTEVPLPAGARRLVWVVDYWNPGLPRPPGLRERPVPHGRWLYVLDLDGRPAVHGGYRLVPPPG